MDNSDFVKALEKLRKEAPKRKFVQSVDLIINLVGLDLKKPENQIELFIQLKSEHKKTKICGIVGPELAEQARANFDLTITPEDFPKYADKRLVKKLAKSFDWFVAQATIMPEVAKVFGRVLGPRGKMPNPKAGCVVPSNANLRLIAERLRKTIKVSAKTQPSIKVSIGNEAMSDDALAENAMSVYKAVLERLPEESESIKNVLIKFTMSKPTVVGATEGEND
ncbi:MAG: 50S ribosomal protein L1 [Candidatus Woesearchaeota archaeon]